MLDMLSTVEPWALKYQKERMRLKVFFALLLNLANVTASSFWKKTTCGELWPRIIQNVFFCFWCQSCCKFFLLETKVNPYPTPTYIFCNSWRPHCHILDHRHMSLKVPNVEFNVDVYVWHCLLSTLTLKLNSTLGTHLHAIITSFWFWH